MANKLYLCNPRKNTECKKTACQSDCFMTTKKECSLDGVGMYVANDAIPVDFIWDRAEWYEKQWIDNENHWAKNVAEALRALLEDWDGEVGGILEKYEER